MKSLQLFKKLGFACNTRICNPNRISNPSSLSKFPYSSPIYPSSSTQFHPLRFFSSTSSNGGSDASKALKEAVNSSLQRLRNEEEYYTEKGVDFRIVDLPRKSKILLHRESDGDTVQVLAQDDTSENSIPRYRLTINIVKKDGRCMECICNTYGSNYIPRTVMMKRSKAESFSSVAEYDPFENPVAFRSWDEATDYLLGYGNWKGAFYSYLEARGVDSSITKLLEKYKRQKNNVNVKHVNEFVENKDVSTQANTTGANHALQSSTSIAPTSVNNLRDTAACLKEALTNEIKRIKSSEELHRHLLKCDPNYVCPFEIVDNPGKYTPTFKREIDGDSIQVETSVGYKETPVTVIIRMKDGTRLRCWDHHIIWVERPEGWYKLWENQWDDLTGWDDDSELPKYMFRYLEWAGIDYSFHRFLHNYTLIRLRREYIRLLKKMKNFV
ncbi:hypothetical protein ACHQM5_021889 [Ranunculus cassubicifolius]